MYFALIKTEPDHSVSKITAQNLYVFLKTEILTHFPRCTLKLLLTANRTLFSWVFFLNSTEGKNSRGCHCKHINMYHKNQNKPD